jgi:hypothetical protein
MLAYRTSSFNNQKLSLLLIPMESLGMHVPRAMRWTLQYRWAKRVQALTFDQSTLVDALNSYTPLSERMGLKIL